MRKVDFICIIFFVFSLGCRASGQSNVKNDSRQTLSIASPTLYSDESTLQFTIKAPFDELMNFGQPIPFFITNSIEVDGEIIFDSKIIAVKISNRGRTSKQECKFFKLKVSIQDDEAAIGTPFSSPGSFKLATHCDKRNQNSNRVGDERAVNRERALYRIAAEITGKSYHSRLAEINYQSTDSDLNITKQAFLLERFRHFRKRNDIDETLNFKLKNVDPVKLALNHLFQIYALNNDWQIERLNMFQRINENLILTRGTFNYRLGTSPAESFIVPYDFDIAGMVNGSTYWEQNSQFFMPNQADSAKSQIHFLFYAARLHDPEVFHQAIERIRSLKQNILKIISKGNIDPEGKTFYDQRTAAFFKLLDDEAWKKVAYIPAGTKFFKDAGLSEPMCIRLPKFLPIAVKSRDRGVVEAEVPGFTDVPISLCPGIFSLEPGTPFWISEDQVE